jgi:hypothetical protein
MRALGAALVLAATISSAAPAAAQKKNAPELCPYCEGQVGLMELGGLVSHGGFEFGRGTTGDIDSLLGMCDIRWIETEHFQIGFALGTHKVKQEEKAKIRAELTRLAESFPAVKPKTKILDSWLRAHLYAQRAEDHWDRFVELMQIDERAFPKSARVWNMVGEYMGQGPYLGQEGKYEILILPSEASSMIYLREQFGLIVRLSQRWNHMERDTISLTAHVGQGDLRTDEALHGHVVFNLTINLLDGYKHYSYELPVWIREGLGHWMERDINPRFNTFNSAEGAVADMTRKEKWQPEVLKLVSRRQAVRMAELIHLKGYGELELRHHYTTWSMVDWMLQTNPDGMACFVSRLTGLLNEHSVPDGSGMPDAHRDAVKDCFGMSYAQLDSAWAEWVKANYSAK